MTQLSGRLAGLLPNMTAEEKRLLAEKEREIKREPEKKGLDETAQGKAETATVVEKTQANGIAA